MIPTALASWNTRSEANAPLARAILGGLIAGEPATLFVLPALYAFFVRDRKNALAAVAAAHWKVPGADYADTRGWAVHLVRFLSARIRVIRGASS